MPTEQITDDDPNPVEFPAVTADMHLLRADERSMLPVSRPAWPLAPWRFVLIATAIAIAIPCGIAAAAPPINGAELGCGIAIVTFLAALFTPGKDS